MSASLNSTPESAPNSVPWWQSVDKYKEAANGVKVKAGTTEELV